MNAVLQVRFFSLLKSFVIGAFLVAGISLSAQTTYEWVGGNSAWSTAGNWSSIPGGNPRTTPAVTDILLFNNGATNTVTAVPTQTIGQLLISNNTTITLQAATTNTLTITPGTGNTGLQVASGSSLSNTAASIMSITSTNSAQVIDISGTLTWLGGTFLASGNTLNISGTINQTTGTITSGAVAGTVVNLSGTWNQNSGTTTLLGGTISGTMNVLAGTLNMNNATYPTTITSSGIINHTGGTITGTAAGLSFASGSNYNYLATGALIIPTATWDTNSNVNITGITSAATIGGISTQSFGNFNYNCTSQSAVNVNLAATFTVKGDMTISSTGSGTLFHKISTTVLTLTVNGNLNMTGGNFTQNSGGTAAATLTVGGTFNMDGGTFNSSTANIACTINIAGSFDQSGGVFTRTAGTTLTTINFTGVGDFIISGGTHTNTLFNYNVAANGNLTLQNNLVLANSRQFTVAANGRLNFGTYNISGVTLTTFSVASGGTISLGDQLGITTSGATGNVQTNARTFTVGANFIYAGTNGQVTGNALPVTNTGYIQIDLQDNSDQITFTNTAFSGSGVNVRLRSGSLANAITFTNTTNSILTYEGVAAQTTTDNEFPATNGPRSLVINNPNGVTLHAPRSTNSGATNTLTLTSGTLNTTLTNILTVSNATVGAVVGGNESSYVNGPLIRAINAAGQYNFPVGDGAVYGGYSMLTTAAASGVSLRTQFVNAASGGTAGLGLSSIEDYHWLVERTAGTTSVTYTPTLTISGLVVDSRVGYSKTITGAYENAGGTGIGASITAATSQTISTADQNAYYTIGTTGALSGTQTAYTTLTSIATALQTMIVTGNVIFELPTSYSGEPAYPVVFTQFAEDGSGPYNVTIRPETGSTNFLTAGTPGTGNPLINLNGIDRLTIDGRAGGSGSNVWTFRNTQTAATVGPTFQFINDATFNTLTYLTVEGQNITGSSGTILFSTAAGLSLGNSNNTISYCDIRENTATGTTPANGIYSLGTASIINSSNTITNNKIYNNFVAGIAGAGVWIGANNTNWTITDNHFYQTAARTGTANSITRYGIYVATATTAGFDNFTITGNSIGGSEPNTGGTAMTINGAVNQSFSGIYFAASSTSENNKIENNVIKNIVCNHTLVTTTANPTIFTGIWSAAGTTAIRGNTIGASTGTGSITVNYGNTSASSGSYGIYVTAGNDTIQNNIIGSITLASATNSSLLFNGIGVTGSGTSTITGNLIGSTTTANSINVSRAHTAGHIQGVTGISMLATGIAVTSNNTIANLNSNYAGTTAGSQVRGIITGTTGVNTITNNTIFNLNNAAAIATTGATASVIGISQLSTTSGQTVGGNTIHSLTCSHPTAANSVIGINYTAIATGLASANNVTGNTIHSLGMATSSTAVGAIISGIYINAGLSTISNNMIRLGIDSAGAAITTPYLIYGIFNASATAGNLFYYNSVYVGGTGVASGTNNTYSFYKSAANSAIDIRNNILINARGNAGGTAAHYAMGFAVLHTAANLTSNNNLFNTAGTGGAVGLMFTTPYATLNDWQTGTTEDISSIYGVAGFINPTGNAATVDLHINTSNPTQVEGAADSSVGPNIDIDGDPRFGNGVYSGSGTNSDIGADEGEFIPQDATPPLIVYTNIPTQTSFVAPTLSATITDANAVDVATGFAPRVYFKRSTDANEFNNNTNGTDGWKYVESTTGSSPFSLTLDYTLLNGGTGVSAGNTIQYFVVAQDTSSNVAINSGTFASQPSDVQLTSAAFPLSGTINSYYINVLNGTYTVGSGGDFASLTNAGGLFETINTGGFSGNVIAEITSDLTSELGTFALNQWAEIGAGGYTLTIRPSAATTRTISGSLNGDLFRLDGADRVMIDGRFGGSGQHLIFANTSATAGASTIAFLNEATSDTIRYVFLRGSGTSTTKGVVLFGTSIAAGTLGNSNNAIEYCDIHQNASALPTNGVYSAGSTSKLNVNNTIRNNNIYNFFNAAGGSNGISLAANTSSWTIENNKFYQEATRTTTTASTFHYVININNTTNASTIIRGNTIGGNASDGTGTMTYTSTLGYQLAAIYLNTNSTTSTPTIVENNTITNISVTTISGATSGIGPFSAIYQLAGASRIIGNTIGATTGNDAITVTVNTNALGVTNGIRYDGTAIAKIENNTIGSFTIGGGSGTNNGQTFYGINVTTGNVAIKNNTIGSPTSANSIRINSPGTPITSNASVLGGINVVSTSSYADSIVFNNIYNLTNFNAGTATRILGISATSGAQYFIDDNTIRNLSLTASTNVGTTSTPAVLGVALVTANINPLSLSRNKIYALSNAGSGASAWTIGIHYSGGTNAGNTIEGNFIHCLSPSTGASASVCGLQLAGGTTTNVRNNMIRLGIDASGTGITQAHNIFGIQQTVNAVHNILHNSVYIGGTGVGGALNTFAYHRNQATVNAALALRNNIFVNNRSNGSGTGVHYAVGFTTAMTTALTSDYNIFHTNGTGGALGLMGATPYSTLAAWQSGTSKDGTSIYGDPQFEDATGDADNVDLHLSTTLATPAEAAGTDLGVTLDYDGETRSGLTPTDIGADAGSFIPLDIVAPIISYTNAGGVCNSATTQTLSGVTITDTDSDVNVTSGTKPRLYYKKSSDSNDLSGWQYVEASGSTSPFDFTITLSSLGTLNPGDVIQYFVVAQDEGPDVYTPNVAINSGTFAATPISVALTADAFPIGGTINSFMILPCSGSVTVGSGGMFPSLTNDGGLFQALNAATLSGSITATVISDLSETGTHALNQWTESGAGGYTVTITPDAGTTRTIAGDYNSTGGLFRMNGADRVVFDGRNPADLGANGRHLLFRNTNAVSSLNNSTFYVFNDANNLTFRNLIVEGATAQTSNGVFRIDAAGAGDGNDYITITQNQIRDRSDATGIPANGIYIVGALNEVNDNVSITNNEIFNYHAAGQHSAIYVGSYNSDFDITGNSIFDPVTRTTAADKYGIFIDAATGGGVNFDISNNFIGGSAAGATGTWTVNSTGTTDYRFVGISVSTALNSNSTINSNTIRNFNITTGSVFQTQGGLFAGIYASNGDAVISENTIGGSTGNITIVSGNTSSFGFVYGVFHSGNGAVTITDNIIGGFALSNATSSAGIRSLIGIRATTSSTSELVDVSGNTIGNSSSAMSNSTGNTYSTTTAIINAGIYVTGAQPTAINNNNIGYFSYNANGQSTSGAFQVAGIYRASAAAVNTITGNEINNITSQSPYAGTAGNAGLSGIYCVTSSNDQLIELNEIHTIKNTNTGSGAPAVYGIYSGSGTSTTNRISRNLIHSLQSSTTGASDIAGIYLGTGGVTASNNKIRLGLDETGAGITTTSMFQGIVKNNTSINNNIYYNSVYIGGSGVGSTATSTYAFRKMGHNASDNVRNNIFVNARSNSATGGKHYGVHFNVATSFVFSNNLIYTSGTGNVFGGAATSDYASLPLFNSALTFPVNNISADPNFTAPTAATPDLHLNVSGASPAESAGVIISGVEDDFDATGVRIGYPQSATNGGGTSPDMGADETDVIPDDVTAPTVIIGTAIPAQTTVCGTTLNLTVTATVTDGQSGVDTGSLAPTLWWRLNTGTYASLLPASVAGNVYTYNLTITGIAIGDIYHYYVAAQDLEGNIGYSHQDGSSPVHTDVSTAPSTLNGAPATFSVISATPLSGTVTVGTSGDYTSLTKSDGLFRAIFDNGLSGDLRVEIISNTTEDGNFPLYNWAEYCGSNYRVTIVPNAATERVLSGSLMGMGLIPIYASRVTIDGRFNGSGRYLKFENTYASSGGSENSTFRFGSGTALASSDTLRYCEVVGNTTKTAGAVVHMQNISGLVIENNLLHGGSSNWAMNIIRSDASNTITIKNNEIYNFLGWSGGVSTRSYGILVPSGNGSNWNIEDNSIYNTGINSQNVQTALAFNPGSSSSNNNIRKNWIGGSSAQCGTGGAVTYWGNQLNLSNTETIIKGIEVNSGTVVLDSNNVANIRVLGSDYTAFIGLHILGSTSATVTNNVFGKGTDGEPSSTDPIQVAGGAISSGFYPGYLYGIWNQSTTTTTTVYDKNDFYNLRQTGVWTGGQVFGIWHGGSSAAEITNNRIKGLSSGGIGYNSFAIRLEPTTSTSNNIISSNIITTPRIGDFYTNQVASIGIYINILNSRTVSGTISNNRIDDDVNLEASGFTEGIYLNTWNGNSSSNGNWDIHNNMIYLSNPGETEIRTEMHGIDIQVNNSSTVNAFYNTIWIDGFNRNNTSTLANPSSAILSMPGPSGAYGTLNLRNNILMNTRQGGSPNSDTYHVAIWRSTASTTGFTSDNNLFLYRNGATYGRLAIYGLNAMFNLSTWQGFTSTDVNTINPTWTTGSSNFGSNLLNSGDLFTQALGTSDLHLDDSDGQSYLFPSNEGAVISVTTDFDGETRDSSTPDIGADEYSAPCITPVITAEPLATQQVCVDGTPTNLTVTATGASSYQWFSNTTNSNTGGTNLGSGSGAQTATYTPPTSSAGTLYYYVEVTGTCPTPDVSAVATVTVIHSPAITVYSPLSFVNTICEGSSTSFGVTATGGGTLSYLWEVSTNGGGSWSTVANAAPYSGIGTNTLSISNTPVGLNGYLYRVTVTNSCSSVTSTNGTLNVNAAPAITAEPLETQSVCQSSSPSDLTVTATGYSLTYQWYSNTTDSNSGGTNLGSGSGAQTATFTPPTSTLGTTYYYVVVSSLCGAPLASEASEVIVAAPFSILTEPITTQTVCQNDDASEISVEADGGTLTYQWYSNTTDSNSGGTSLGAGAQSPFYTPSTSTAGTTYYYAVVTGGCGSPLVSETSEVIVNSTVAPSVSIAADPGSVICDGTSVTFTATPSNGGSSPVYQWKVNGNNVGTNSTTYTTSSLNNGDVVTCEMTGNAPCISSGAVASNEITMTVNPEPEVYAGTDMTTCITVPITFANGALAEYTSSILWTHNGTGTLTNAGTLTPTYTAGTGETSVTFTLTGDGNGSCDAGADVVVLTITSTTFYQDGDGDGFGNPSVSVAACSPPEGYVDNNLDFCDTNPVYNPNTQWWADLDGDGFGGFIFASGDLGGGCDNPMPGELVLIGGDCDDSNANVNPASPDICTNSIDDNCNGLVNENCSSVANDLPLQAITIPLSGNSYPNCGVITGSLTGAADSPESAGFTGSDVWYKFTAVSSAVSITMSGAGQDNVLTLYDNTITLMSGNSTENVLGTGGTEILNYSGLTVGQLYYISVGAVSGTGSSFSICLKHLTASFCADGSGTYQLCSNLKAAFTGANTYTYNFTPTGTTGGSPTSITYSSGQLPLALASIAIRYGGTYLVRIDANYSSLTYGNGQTEDPITVQGIQTCNITIAPHAEMYTKESQQCPATVLRNSVITAKPFICGATGFTVEFTKVTDCTGATAIGFPFEVNTTGASPSRSLNFTVPQSITSQSYYRVRWRPNFSYGSGTFGLTNVIFVGGSASGEVDLLGQVMSNTKDFESGVRANLYPNPNKGELVNINLTDITSPDVFVRVMDSMGRVVYSNRFTADGSLNAMLTFARPLAGGIYMVEMTTGDEVITRRMIVER